MRKKLLIRILLVAWIATWLLFLARPYFKEGLLSEYFTLMKLSPEEKKAFILGPELHRFINYCKEYLRSPFTYKIIGLEGDSIDCRRTRYYLYPNIENKNPDFILVYKKSGFSEKGYELFKSIDAEQYILRKIK